MFLENSTIETNYHMTIIPDNAVRHKLGNKNVDNIKDKLSEYELSILKKKIQCYVIRNKKKMEAQRIKKRKTLQKQVTFVLLSAIILWFYLFISIYIF